MWYVPDEKGVMVPLVVVNARAKIAALLSGHDVTHGGAEYPFCEDYGCGSIREISSALDSEPVVLLEE